MKTVQKLLNPKNIAVVGVSSDPNKIGSIIFNNIINGGFKGRVYPINPKYTELFGFKVFPEISDIKDDKIDLAIISVPSAFVLDVLKKAKNKVSNVIIISAGFSEIGTEGIAVEDAIKQIALESGINILGPNCLGIINPLLNLNASFSAQSALPGNIAFVSQSGALCTMMLDLASEINLGFGHFVSLGNKSDLNEHHFISYWNELEGIDAIFAYLEEIEDGDKFYKLLKSINKPLVVLTPGKSESAKEAISSHTGSIASPNQVIHAALTQSNAIIVDTPEEMFAAMIAFSWGKTFSENQIAVVTNAGGPGVISTDLLEETNLKLSTLDHTTVDALKNILPAESSLANPIDILGTGTAEMYSQTLNQILDDKNVGAALVIITPQLITQIEDTAKRLVNIIGESDKTVIPVFLGGKYSKAGLVRLYDNKIAAFNSLEKGIFALKTLLKSNVESKKLKVVSGHGKHNSLINKLINEQAKPLPFKIIEELVEEFKIKLPNQKIVYNLKELEEFLDNARFPLVLKALPEDVMHKTDIEALYLNIKTEMDLFTKFIKLQKSIEKKLDIKNVGLLVQEQILGGTELFLGVKRDGSSQVYKDEEKGFGHMLVFGTGGIYTEIYKDFSYGLIPMDKNDIENMIMQTKISSILKGARGLKPLAMSKLVELISLVQDLVTTYPQIYEVDFNPLMLTTKEVWPVDIKVIVKA